MLTAEKNRSHQALPTVRRHVAAHITWLEQALADLDGELDQTLHASPLWCERDQLVRRVPGGGPVVARTGLAERPARGQGSAKRIATLVGLAPLNRDRGAWRGSRAIWGGRAHGRAVLSLAALVGVRHTPALRAGSARLLARGTPQQVALTACRHPRLLIWHALLRDRTPWQPARFA